MMENSAVQASPRKFKKIRELNRRRNYFFKKMLMRSAINEGQKARYLESKNVSIYESELQKKHPF